MFPDLLMLFYAIATDRQYHGRVAMLLPRIFGHRPAGAPR